MAVKPGIKPKSNKNPAFFSHEFVIQNHADIVSCVAMVFVVGLMLQATSSIASIFIALHHNVTGLEPSQEHPRGQPFTYESGWKDLCAIFFYTLICIIMHAILQEYVLDKITKKLHLSKFKLTRFNESGQLVVFYLMSFLWGVDIIVREGYIGNVSLLWQNFPEHPMIFLHKLFFIIQLSYYVHMLPELYFQKVKREDLQNTILHSIAGFSLISTAYFMNFQRLTLVLLTLHYSSELICHAFQLIQIFDKEEKFSQLRHANNFLFIIVRSATVILSLLTLFYGIENSQQSNRGLIALFAIYGLQGYLTFRFMTEYLKKNRETQAEQKKTANKMKISLKMDNSKAKKERKIENDLPEADQQQPSPKEYNKEQHHHAATKKLKSK